MLLPNLYGATIDSYACVGRGDTSRTKTPAQDQNTNCEGLEAVEPERYCTSMVRVPAQYR